LIDFGDNTKSLIGYNSSERFSFLYAYFIAPFLSEKYIIEVLINKLIRSEMEFSDPLFHKVLSEFLHLAINKVEWNELDPSLSSQLTQNAMKVWLSLSSEIDQAHDVIVEYLEDIIILNLETNDVSAFALYNFSSEDLIRSSISRLLRKKSDYKNDSLLVSIIATDLTEYVPRFLKLHVEHIINEEYLELFNDGVFDEAFCKAIVWKDTEGTYDEALTNVGNLLNKRAEMISQGMIPTACRWDSFLSLLIAFTNTKHMQINNFQAVIVLLANFMDDRQDAFLQSSTVRISWTKKFLILAGEICKHVEKLHCKNSSAINSAMTNYLLKHIPLSLKAHFRKKSTPASFHVLSPKFLLKLAKSLLTNGIKRPQNHVAYDEAVTSSFFRECLRCGLQSISEVEDGVQIHCIRVVRLFIETIQKTERTTNLKSNASNVFAMVTKHSKFTELLVPETLELFRNNNKQKLEVILLIRCCLLIPNDILFDEDVWRILLASYNAGVSFEDSVLRQILVIYAEKASFCPDSEKPNLIFSDQMRWGTLDNSTFFNFQWDWLVDSIDVKRVHATLRNFPLMDAIDPLTNSECGQDDLIGQANSSRSTRGGVDEPYSPGFLLQLIYSSLESCGVAEKSSHTPRTTLAQRLCERGGLSLCLASLSSKCSGVRSLAVSIMGTLSDIADSIHARRVVSWRERPQILLLLNSVRVALVIRQAEERKESGAFDIEIPRLPGFSAIYLARAALIICRPGDQLFPAVNRSLLRTEVDSGAFQDLTRVPVFVSLFCSSSDEKQQIFSERRFALELVKDGLIDDESYKLLLSCHCAEMLLACSSWKTPVTIFESPFSCDEVTLILNTMLAFVERGGERSKAHLISRLGLLSWIRSLLVGRPLFEFLPSVSSRISFIDLAKTVVKATAPELSLPEMMTVTSGVINVLLSLTLNSADHGCGEAKFSLLSSTVDLLEVLSSSLFEKRSVNEPPDEGLCLDHLNGVQIELAVEFLFMLPPDRTVQSALMSLCTLPLLCNEKDSIHVNKFCSNAIDLAGSCNDDLKLAILSRMLDLSFFYDGSERETEEILRKLVSWKVVTSHDDKLRKLWQNCLASFITSIRKVGICIPSWVRTISLS
jgi:hypothetical protein